MSEAGIAWVKSLFGANKSLLGAKWLKSPPSPESVDGAGDIGDNDGGDRYDEAEISEVNVWGNLYDEATNSEVNDVWGNLYDEAEDSDVDDDGAWDLYEEYLEANDVTGDVSDESDSVEHWEMRKVSEFGGFCDIGPSSKTLIKLFI